MSVSKMKTHQTLLAASLLVLGLTTALPPAAQAQATARAMVTIKDAATDAPIEGAKVTFSFKPTSFSETRETNKKGQATFTLRDGPVDYKIAIEKEGYNPANSQMRPVTGQTLQQVFRIEPLQRPAETAVDPNAKLTPAQETFNQGVLALQSGETAAAQGKFEEALRLDPKLVAAESALGGIYLENKEFAAAEASARKVVASDANNPRGQRLLYEALRGQGKADEAKEILKVLVDLEKDGDATALIFNEGTEALRLGDNKTARERFEQALQLKPDLDQARGALMVLYIKAKDYANAAAAAEALLARRPNDVTAKRVRYDAYKGLGDTVKAKEAFDILAAADPKVLIKGLYDEAQAAFNNGDTQTAMGLLDQIQSIDAENPKAFYLRGLCLTNLGKNAEAKTNLEKFLALAPNDPQAKTAKEMIGYLK